MLQEGKILNEKADMWSLGVILHKMLSGFFPFKGENEEALADKIRDEVLSLSHDVWEEVSIDGQDMIDCLIDKDQERRLSSSQIFTHCWLHSNCLSDKVKNI